MTLKDIFNWFINTPILEVVLWVGLPVIAFFILMFICAFVYSIWNSVSESIYFPEKPLEKKLGYKFGRYIGNKLRKKK